MAKKKRKGLLDDDFQSLTYKEKKSKIKDIKIPTIQDTNITGDKSIEYGFAGGKKLGKTNVGAIQTKAQEQNKTTKNGKDTFLDSDGNEVGKFKSEVRDNKSFKGKKNTLGTDKGNKLDRIEKRVAKRQGQKEERKNYRAAKLAKRRGMSPEQAKDFMQNRRTRLNQAVGEFGKALATGGQMDWGKLDKRLYRKKGTGTLQNMKSKDGGTYDATAPYKGTAEKGYADRGLARDEADTYTKIMGPKVNIKPADPIKLTAFRGPQKEEKETKEDIVNSNKDKVTGNTDVLNKGLDSIQSSDQAPPNRVARDNIRTRDSGGFYNTEATGNQAMQNAKQRQSSNSLSELLSKVTANPNDILDDIRRQNIDRPTGTFRSKRR
tara:strand:+ start:194 stop:1324 length:1131 start_codon:yes stop_codon:yes gene_type:complete